jgi:hypothetical protein
MKLTDTQLVLLSAASQREDAAVIIAPNLKGSAASKVVGKMLRDELIEEVSAGNSLPVWRRDDDHGPLALRITKRGLAAQRPQSSRGHRGGASRDPCRPFATAWRQHLRKVHQ